MLGLGSQPTIALLVGGVVGEHLLDRRIARAILVVVQPADEVVVDCAAVGQPLGQAQLLLVGRDGHVAVGKVDEVDGGVAGDFVGVAAGDPLGVVGAAVLPVGQRSLDGRVVLLAHKAFGHLPVGDAEVGPALMQEVVDFFTVGLERAALEDRVFAEDGIVHILDHRQIQAKHLEEETPAVGALARTIVVAAVVAASGSRPC